MGTQIGDLAPDQQATLIAMGLNVPREGKAVMGVPVGSAGYNRRYLQDAVFGDSTELLRASVPLEDI